MRVADAHAELLRQILAEHDAVVVLLVSRLQIGQLARHDRFLDVRDGRLELGIDAFEADEGIGARRRRQRAADDRRRRADDARNLAQRLDFGAVVLDAGRLEDERRGRSSRECDRAARSAGPVIIAIAMMSASTPTVTPSVETSEMIEMNACRRRASR